MGEAGVVAPVSSRRFMGPFRLTWFSCRGAARLMLMKDMPRMPLPKILLLGFASASRLPILQSGVQGHTQ